MKCLNLLLFLVVVFSSCQSSRLLKEVKKIEADYQHHAGFVLYDLEKQQTVVAHRADRYFTPASNTKIFTLYAVSQILGDSIPGLAYSHRQDSLFIWGTGDPTFLHPLFSSEKVYDFLKEAPDPLYVSTTNFQDTHFGPGWSWDDYNYRYSTERSGFPVYANLVYVNKSGASPYLKSPQAYFKQFFTLGDTLQEYQFVREMDGDVITYFPGSNEKSFDDEVPFRQSPERLRIILQDTLKRKVERVNAAIPVNHEVVYSNPVEPVLAEMMKESDNFLAEQFLQVCAFAISDTLQADIAIEHAKKTFLKNAPDAPIWVDGSGLSRYNLFTPRTFVWLWNQLLAHYGEEKLFELVAVGGERGTLETYYVADTPFVFGKTGTLSNNCSISGILRAKSGKLFVFSMMNNNYPTESYPVKRRVEKLLTSIYEKY